MDQGTLKLASVWVQTLPIHAKGYQRVWQTHTQILDKYIDNWHFWYRIQYFISSLVNCHRPGHCRMGKFIAIFHRFLETFELFIPFSLIFLTIRSILSNYNILCNRGSILCLLINHVVFLDYRNVNMCHAKLCVND